MYTLVVPKMELAMRSVCISSAHKPSDAVLDLDRKDFSGETNGLQLTAPSRFFSNTNFDGIDETRGNVTIEANDLSVSEKMWMEKQTRITNTCRVILFAI